MLSLSILVFFFFFFNDTATTEIYTLSLHDALPISFANHRQGQVRERGEIARRPDAPLGGNARVDLGIQHLDDELGERRSRSEEHTSELQSLAYLVCRLLLEKKKKR